MEKSKDVMNKNLVLLRHMEFMGANPYEDEEIRDFFYEMNKRDPFTVSKSYSINKYCMENCKGRFYEKMKSEDDRHFRIRIEQNKFKKCIEIIHNNIININTYENNNYHKTIKNFMDSYLPDPLDKYDQDTEEEIIQMVMSLYVPDSEYFQNLSLEDEILPWNILNLFSRFYDKLDDKLFSLNESQTMMLFKLYMVMKYPGMLPCFFKQVDIYHKCENAKCDDIKILHSVYTWPGVNIKPFSRNNHDNDRVIEYCRLCNSKDVTYSIMENNYMIPYVIQDKDYENTILENDMVERKMLTPFKRKDKSVSYKKISCSPNSTSKKISAYIGNISPSKMTSPDESINKKRTHNLLYVDDNMPKETTNFISTINMLWLIESDKIANANKRFKKQEGEFVSYKKDNVDKKVIDSQEEQKDEEESEEENEDEEIREYNDLFDDYYEKPVNVYKMIKELNEKKFDFTDTKMLLDEFCLKFNLNIFDENVFDLNYEENVKISNMDFDKYDNIIFNINGYYFHALNDKEKGMVYVYGDYFKEMSYEEFIEYYSNFEIKINLLHYNKNGERKVNLLTRNVITIISNIEYFVF